VRFAFASECDGVASKCRREQSAARAQRFYACSKPKSKNANASSTFSRVNPALDLIFCDCPWLAGKLASDELHSSFVHQQLPPGATAHDKHFCGSRFCVSAGAC